MAVSITKWARDLSSICRLYPLVKGGRFGDRSSLSLSKCPPFTSGDASFGKYHLGSTLIEVAISTFLLSLFLFGFFTLEINSFNRNLENYYRNIALTELDNFNPADFLNWQQEIKNLLPQAAAKIDQNNKTIILCWKNKNLINKNQECEQLNF
jgi:hypothetical protein